MTKKNCHKKQYISDILCWTYISGPAIRAHSAAAELADLAEVAELGNTDMSVFIGDSARIRSIFLV